MTRPQRRHNGPVLPVKRLILISTTHLRWPRNERSCTKHQEMLGRLLDPTGPGNAWFACLDPWERRDATHRITRELPVHGDLDPGHWHARGGDAVPGLMEDIRARCHESICARDEFDVALLRPLRHRVFLDRRALEHATGWTTPEHPSRPREGYEDFYAVLDFRFDELRGDLQLRDNPICHANLSVWSGPPWSGHHRPGESDGFTAPARSQRADRHGRVRGPGPADRGRRAPPAPDLLATAECRNLFGEARRRTATFLEERFTTANLRVFGRPYRAPTFWTAVSRVPPADPLSFLDRRERVAVPNVASSLLATSDERDPTVSRSVLGGEMLVLRRFAPDPSDQLQDVPTYVILPAAPHRRSPGPQTAAAEQEDRVRETITTLTDLEAEAAAQLWAIETDVDIWDNHLFVYDHAVNRASRIWDGLATHLVTARGRALAKIYKSVELLHQTLLQGIADVDRIATEAGGRRADLTETVRDLDHEYGERFAEHEPRKHPSIRRSLTATGPFVKVTEAVDAMAQRADRVAANYRNLLAAIGNAFDERRVRETDTLQKSGAALAWALATVGFITGLDAVFKEKYELGDSALLLKWAPIVGICLFLLGVLAWWGRTWWRMQTLVSRRYRRIYKRLWRLLRDSSTGRLDLVSRQIELESGPDAGSLRAQEQPEGLRAATLALNDQDKAAAKTWRKVDDTLSREFAAVWDYIDRLPGKVRTSDDGDGLRRRPAAPATGSTAWARWRQRRRTRSRSDQAQLQKMVEGWSLRTLLLTERPRAMWHYDLPRLTMMYRAAFWLLAPDRIERQVLSLTDLRFVLARFPTQALRSSVVPAIDDWLRREAVHIHNNETEGHRAHALLTKIRDAGFEVGMGGGWDDKGKRVEDRERVNDSERRVDEVKPVGHYEVLQRIGALAPTTEEGSVVRRRSSRCSVSYSARTDSWWVTAEADVQAVRADQDQDQDQKLFCPVDPAMPAQRRSNGRGLQVGVRLLPEHRDLLDRIVSRAEVDGFKQRLGDLVAEQVRSLTEPQFDLMTELVAPLAETATLEFLGFAAPDIPRLRGELEAQRRPDAATATGPDASAFLTSCLRDVTATRVGQAEAGLSNADRAALLVPLTAAISAWTTQVLSTTLRRLLAEPVKWSKLRRLLGQPVGWSKLRRDRGRWEGVMAAALTEESSMRPLHRRVVRATTLGGTTLRAGSELFVALGAPANDSPDETPALDLGWPPSIGQDFAIAARSAVVEALMDTFDDIRIDATPPTEKTDGWFQAPASVWVAARRPTDTGRSGARAVTSSRRSPAKPGSAEAP